MARRLRPDDQYSLGVHPLRIALRGTAVQRPRRCGALQRHPPRAPPAPRTHRKDVPVDLETICLQADEQKPRRAATRTVGELADDLRAGRKASQSEARRMGPVERVTRLIASLLTEAGRRRRRRGLFPWGRGSAVAGQRGAALREVPERKRRPINGCRKRASKPARPKVQAEQDLHEEDPGRGGAEGRSPEREWRAANLKAEGTKS